jgi:hypothetical protein
VSLERGPLSLVNTIEELLGIKSSGSGIETYITAAGIRRADHVAPLSAKVGLTSPTSGCCSVGIVRSRTKATEFSFSYSCNLFLSSPFQLILHLGPYFRQSPMNNTQK